MAWTVVFKVAVLARMSCWASLTPRCCRRRGRRCRSGTVASAVASSTTVGGTRRAHPDLLAGRHRGSIGDRHRARRVREHVPARGGDCGVRPVLAAVLVLTVNGPSTLPAGPLRLRRGDGEAGRWRLDQRPRRSDVVHDGDHGRVQRVSGVQHVTVGEEPDGRLHGGGPLVEIGQRGRLVGVGVVLVEQPRHEAHVGDVGGVPGAQHVPDAAVRKGVDVDAVEAELRAAAGRPAMDDSGEALVLGGEAGGRVARGIAVA